MTPFRAADIQYALRLLRRSPGFTLITILVLAGGLGLSTFTFSFLYTAMVRPLPLSDGERIVRVDPVVQGKRLEVDAVDVAPLRTSLRTVTEIGGYTGREVVVGRLGERHVIDPTVTEPVLFSIARTPALMGRTLVPADAHPGAEPVIVLSYRTWEVDFGADSRLLNSLIPLNGVSTRVVGIMPKGYGFPVSSQAWMPLPAPTLEATKPGAASLRLVARLAPNASYNEAAAEATHLLRLAVSARDSSPRAATMKVAVESFPSVQIGEERTLVFTALNVLATLILLLALVNVTNLLLARANERTRETAVRLALGASSGRLVMRGMWETIILCIAGGALGTAGVAWGLRAITGWTRSNLEGNLAFWWVWQMDGVTLITAAAWVTVAVVVLGSVISLRTMRMNVREVMQDGSARSGSQREGRLSRTLVAAQVTTVTALMFFGVMAGVIADRVMTLNPGFSTTKLLQSGIAPPVARYTSERSRAALFRNLHDRLAGDAEFDGVILRTSLADQQSDRGRFAVRDTRATAVLPSAHIQAVLGDLATLGIKVREGRALNSGDDISRERVVMISSSLANRIWGIRSPLGEQLRLAGVDDTTEFRTIVGVTSDIALGNPLSRNRTSDAIYVPLLQSTNTYSALLVRFRSSETAARQALLAEFAAVDPLLIPDKIQPFDEILRKAGLIARSVSRLFAFCFGFALLLALVGTYALMSHSIGLRTRELGVRRALGASDRVVARMLLTQGGRQLGVGSVLAAPLLAVIALVFQHYFPISGLVAITIAIVVSVSIVALVLMAIWVPTKKVLDVPLSDALRGD